MLVGYVSNERYVALCDVALEFANESITLQARSSATGAVHADIPPGTYQVALQHPGYGSKRVTMTVDPDQPYHFRLLTDCLLGYMWPKAAAAGETSEFRVHAVEEYRLELWRYGAEKQFIRRIGTFDEHGPRATMQITPDGDYTQTGVKWNEQGYNRIAQGQHLTAPDRSGLYYLHARTKSGDFFSFPWVVSPAKPKSAVAVLASDLNWNAYNSFGGRSNYIMPDEFPAVPIVNSRQELERYTRADHFNYGSETYQPLSLDRPEPYNHIDEREQLADPVESRQGCHLAPTEWRFLGWMEQQGLDYDLYSESQFHFDRFNLDDYRTLIITTHPEYWTRHMYITLKTWVYERGGRLIYLGGNGLNCEVEFQGDNHRVVHHNGVWHHPPILVEHFGTPEMPYESRMHARLESEANLLGVVFTFDGAMGAAPYRVVDETHWCFAGTGLKNGDTFGHESQNRRVPGGASGHETDKVSPSSPKNLKILAQGTNPGAGGAHMIHYETPTHGEVFSVGSITWPASLLMDEQVSTITANVIRRFTQA